MIGDPKIVDPARRDVRRAEDAPPLRARFRSVRVLEGRRARGRAVEANRRDGGLARTVSGWM